MSLFQGPSAGLGLSEADNVANDFLRALSQPLLIQTPLQVYYAHTVHAVRNIGIEGTLVSRLNWCPDYFNAFDRQCWRHSSCKVESKVLLC